MWYLCNKYRKLPDDPLITEMDPVLKIWMYHNWAEDYVDRAELAKNHAYLLGSFWNPEAVRQLTKQGNTHESTDEELKESMSMVKSGNLVLPDYDTQVPTQPLKKKKRRTLQSQG